MTSLTRLFMSLMESLRGHAALYSLVVLALAMIGGLVLITRSSYTVRMSWKNGSLELIPHRNSSPSKSEGARRAKKYLALR